MFSWWLSPSPDTSDQTRRKNNYNGCVLYGGSEGGGGGGLGRGMSESDCGLKGSLPSARKATSTSQPSNINVSVRWQTAAVLVHQRRRPSKGATTLLLLSHWVAVNQPAAFCRWWEISIPDGHGRQGRGRGGDGQHCGGSSHTQVRQGSGAPAAARQEAELLPGERNLLPLLQLLTVGQYHCLHKKRSRTKVDVPQTYILSFGQQWPPKVVAKRKRNV